MTCRVCRAKPLLFYSRGKYKLYLGPTLPTRPLVLLLLVIEVVVVTYITTMMTRRMSHCLQMAGWRKDGRFNSGPQRNQARFVKGAEKAFEGGNAHERDCF